MHVCVISSMYPTKRAPHNGVFVTRRIEALQSLGIKVTPYALVREESHLVEIVRKLIGKNSKERFGETIKTDNPLIAYKVIHVRLGLGGVLLNFVTKEAYYAWKSGRKLNKGIKGNYDIVHAHWLYPTGRAAEYYGKKHNLPVFITCHGSDINVFMRHKTRLGCRSTLRKATEVEFVSCRLLKTARDLGGSWKNAHVLPNGIVSVPDSINERTRNRIGFVGNLIDIKRVDIFPSLFANLRERLPEVEFIVVGDGNRYSWLKEKTCGLPITFTGRVSQTEVLKEMQRMSVMILPSRNEGWPCVVLEAHSCGIPVIGSNAGGIPEAIGDDRFVVNEEENESEFVKNYAQRIVDVLSGEIEFSPEQLRRRSKEYMWVNLQKKEKDYYLHYVDSK